ncbi:MAG: class I SAM-dependent methyltransferase, partial [Minicystis sp.]
MGATETPHDQVRYPVGVFEHTHPSRLATLATLFGMRPPPVERCRVLELGCGEGSNLIPMAEALPDARFTGVDLASTRIAAGSAWAAQLGLENLTLEARDILDFEPDPGVYDYIIAHGVYSWVPPAVQEKVLSIVQRGLAPQGVGYVSYNALPGGYLRKPLRDLMLFHGRGLDDPERRVPQSRAIAAFAAAGSPAVTGVYKQVLEGQRDRLAQLADEYLFHDDLCPHNESLYFHDFMERAGRHG